LRRDNLPRAIALAFALAALPLTAMPLAAQTAETKAAGWVLAAEEFRLDGVPPAYASMATILPRLMISRLSASGSRLVLPDEKVARELLSLSAKRTKLVDERATLVLERDRLLLSSSPATSRAGARWATDRKIRAKEREIERVAEEMEKARRRGSELEEEIVAVTLWKDGRELYKVDAKRARGEDLRAQGVSALITGSVRDLAGYMYVSATLETGLPNYPPVTVSEAASYDQADSLVQSVLERLLPSIRNAENVALRIDVSPADATVYVDGRKVLDLAEATLVSRGRHSISATAPGYAEEQREADFSAAKEYRVSIELSREETIALTIEAERLQGDLFARAQYVGGTPVTAEFPIIPTLAEIATAAGTTYFIVDPALEGVSDGARLVVPQPKRNVKERIERQRRVLYWSLGALYVSLPATMILRGISQNMYNAYADGRLEQTAANAERVNQMNQAYDIASYVSIGLGINVFIQIARYLWAANQVTPKRAEPAWPDEE